MLTPFCAFRSSLVFYLIASDGNGPLSSTCFSAPLSSSVQGSFRRSGNSLPYEPSSVLLWVASGVSPHRQHSKTSLSKRVVLDQVSSSKDMPSDISLQR